MNRIATAILPGFAIIVLAAIVAYVRRHKVRAASPGERGKIVRGKITFFKDGRPTITLTEHADASTFIHETGHAWLEELMGDAQHPLAPADLIADAKTVRDWLGSKEGAEITEDQHEQFARGFERYMMEGVAPSKGLTPVFAQFKPWLTEIYQTVDHLNAPITDDIRRVFDRMLSTPAEQTIVAPEGDL